MIGSTEEEQVGSETNAAEPSEEVAPIETIASTSEEDTAQEERTAPTPTSPATNSAAKATEQRELPEGAQAGETESSTTDEIIDSMPSKHTQQALPMKQRRWRLPKLLKLPSNPSTNACRVGDHCHKG